MKNPVKLLGLWILHHPYREKAINFLVFWKHRSGRGKSHFDFLNAFYTYATLIGVYAIAFNFTKIQLLELSIVLVVVSETFYYGVGYFDEKYTLWWQKEVEVGNTTYNPVMDRIDQYTEQMNKRLESIEKSIKECKDH